MLLSWFRNIRQENCLKMIEYKQTNEEFPLMNKKMVTEIFKVAIFYRFSQVFLISIIFIR